MGRPFASELEELEETFAWALGEEVEPLRNALRGSNGPLLAVGSGGSYTAASFAAYLHEETLGELARAATPLDSVDVASKLRSFQTLLISAGGRNKDGLQACEALLRAEPISATILTASKGSPLANLGRRGGARVIECLLPVPRDGFLATNSLFAFCCLLGRAYPRLDVAQPQTLSEVVGTTSMAAFNAQLQSAIEPLLNRDVFLVLHGTSSRAAAIDIESKFSEAALGSVHLSDFRNFGHGRHHWLAKRAAQTGVVALVHESERSLADRTLAQLPPEVPRLRVALRGDALQTTLTGLLAGYQLVAAVGRERGIDPGRPGVPSFGSRLYSLRMPEANVPSDIDIAVRRKVRSHSAVEADADWALAARRAFATVSEARFGSIAMDYDGTLCASAERLSGLTSEITTEIVRLASAGMRIGIATGRGKSVGDALREGLPKKVWKNVCIGYYNGGYVATMADDLPAKLREPRKELRATLAALKERAAILRLATVEPRNPQITVEPHRSEDADFLWAMVHECVLETAQAGVAVVRSGHSLDILAPGVTKLAVVDALPGPVLRIGDRGRFPGNDHALLDHHLGLSVDEVSVSPEHCWNLLPAGVRGSLGALEYLRGIRPDGRLFRLQLAGAGS